MRSILFPHLFSNPVGMLNASSSSNTVVVRRVLRFSAALFVVVLCLTLPAAAQEYNKNKPDQALKADARVDPSTLGMSLGVPLGGASGRAGASLPISLRYSSKLWRLEGGAPFTTTSGIKHTWAYPKYSENSMAGWTSSLEPPRIEYTGEEQLFGSNGQPLGGGIDEQESYGYYVRRIHLHLPDGSSHELRKDDSTPGFPLDNPVYDFSGTYYAVDGSRTRYDYDANSDTGVLYLPDGGRYHFGARQTVTRYGHAQERSWGTTYVDRHGNTMTYNMVTGVWTDTLGRTFTNPLFENPAVGTKEYRVPGVNGNELIYKLHWKLLSDSLRVSNALSYVSNTRCVSPTTYQSIAPYLFTSGGNNVHVCTPTNTAGNPVAFNPVVLARVELPAAPGVTPQYYEFMYNVWGEIEQMIAPGGGYERYSYAQVATLSRANPPYDQANRGVVERWVSPSGTGAEEATHHWSYSITKSTGVVVATTTEPDGTRSERLIYANSFGTQYGFETPLAGMSYDERVYNSANQMLRRTLTGWSTMTPSGSTRPRDPHVTKTVGLILDTGGNALSSTTTMAYDSDLNVTAKHSYDYSSVDQTTAQTGAIGAIPNGTLVRTDETTYLVNDANISAATRDAYRARNMVGLPSSTRVKTAANTVVAQGEVKYDEAAYSLLPSYGAVVGWNDPGTSVRGNVTTTRSWLDTSQSWVETHARYDQVGNLRYAWDANGKQSEVEYSSAYHYAYPTLTRSAIPDPTNNRATNTALVTTTVYDFWTGRATSMKDANGQTSGLSTTFEYNDVMSRLTKVNHPDGGWTMYDYGRNGYGDYVRTRTAINATQNTDAYQYFDGLGRSVRSFGSDGSQSITTDTQYDAMGRVWRVSNPYLSAGAGSAVNPSGRWTTTAYDALGRVTTVTTPDSAVVSTSYSGAQVTVTDQVGKSRRSVSDALGRLTQVVEDPAGVAYQTSYLYDALGNLRKVDQGGQLRFFMYDSLGRLVRAKNPEQGIFTNPSNVAPLTDPLTGNSGWSVAYSYDANGNLTARTDSRLVSTGVHVTATNEYDNINRLKQTTYNNGTPFTLRTYDHAPTNGRGRFYADYESSTSGTINYVNAYDPMGRPTSGQTEFYLAGTGWRPAYTYSRTYDKMGHVTQQTYPSGHAANYSQFDAAGRLKHFSGNLGEGGTPRTYSTNIEYDEASRPLQEQFATQTPLYNKLEYNARGQKTAVRLSTLSRQAAYYNWNRGALIFDYGTTANNGNLVSQHNWVPFTVANDEVTSGTSYQQSYSYDSLNRLTLVQESRLGEGLKFQQGYLYDRWGNRTINQSATTQTLPPGMRREFTVDAQNNRLGVPGMQVGAMSYDPAGNLTEDSYTGAGVRAYDAEGRMTSATTGINSSSSYTYDAAGKRVRRQNSNEAAVWQIYGFDSELLAEYAANAAPTSPQKEYGYRNGELLVTSEDAGAAQPVGWMNAVNVTAGSGGNLSKPAGGAADWSAGAMSTRAIASGDGYVEFSALENNTSRMIGLSHGDSHQSYTDIDFALYAYSDGNMYVYEQGGYVTNLGPYAAGDRYRVSIEAGVVKYRKNGTVLYNSARAARYPLLADTSFYTPGGSLGGVLMAGRQVENVGWTNAVGVTATGNNLSKAGADAWTSGAASQASIAAGDGYVEYTATETNKSRMLGLSNGDSGQSYTDIDFALYTYSDSTLHAYEAGAYIGYLGTYAAGDRLRVAVEGGQVKYLRNGVVVGVSSRAVTYPLVADTALYNTGASLTNVVMSSGGQSGVAVQWLVTDHLGTPRMVVDLSGSLQSIRRHDYLPFGEELTNQGGRTSGEGYAGDHVRQQFTGYERDDETGLDFAQARYFASQQGRFTSVDPLLESGITVNPKTWNRYAYALNNPLRFTDPTGLRACRDASCSGDGDDGWLSNPFEGEDPEAEKSSHTAQNRGLSLPQNEDDYAVLATLLGEASTPGEGSWGPNEYGPEARQKPSYTLTERDVFYEMQFMIQVIENRLRDWGPAKGYKSWKDVVEATYWSKKDNKNKEEFEGYHNGRNILSKIGSSGDMQVTRVRLAIEAINTFHANRNTPIDGRWRELYFWKGIKQTGKHCKCPIVVMREGAYRFANTDFMKKERKH